MFFGIIGILLLAFFVVLKIMKGMFKFILLLIVIGLLMGSFAGRDKIDSAAPSLATTSL